MKLINVTYIEEICAGSSEIIFEMIDIFKSQVSEFSVEMNNLLKKGMHYELGLLAHKSKSSVAIMGMEKLAAMLKELESKAKAGTDPDSYADYISEFESQTRQAIEELDLYVKTLDR